MSELPSDGLHEGVPADVYHHEWEAVSAGRLRNLAITPAHCRWAIDNADRLKDEEGDALRLGRAIHCAVLEPHEFEGRYCADPEKPEVGGHPSGWRNTNLYKAMVAERSALGFEVLAPDEWELCRRMRDSVWSVPSDGLDLLDGATHREASVLATDPKTGLRLKVRPDIVVGSANLLGDLKSTRSATTEDFARDLYVRGYFRAAPYYMDVCTMSGLRSEHYVFLVVEKAPPYSFRTFVAEPRDIDLGRRSYERLLSLYAQCVERNEWPGYTTRTSLVGIPGWARRIEEGRD